MSILTYYKCRQCRTCVGVPNVLNQVIRYFCAVCNQYTAHDKQ